MRDRPTLVVLTAVFAVFFVAIGARLPQSSATFGAADSNGTNRWVAGTWASSGGNDATLVSDDFNRTGQLEGSTTSDGSAVWQHTTGSATLETDGTIVRTSAGTGGGGGYVVPAFTPDVDVSVDVTHADQWAALVVREIDANNRLEIGIRPDTAPQKVWLDIYSGTGYTGSRSADITVTLPAKLRVVASGTNIKVYLDSTLVLDETVTENADGNLHGIATYVDAVNNPGTYIAIDNFKMSALAATAMHVTDDFNRVGGLAGSTTSDGYHTWSLYHPWPHTDPARNIDFTLDGTGAVVDGPGGTDYVTAGALVDVGSADVELRLDVTSSTAEYTEVMFRSVDKDNHLNFSVAGNSSQWVLEKKVAGAVTTIASGALTPTYPHTLEVRAVGTNVRAFIDGSLVTSATVTDHAQVTRHGLHVQARGAEQVVIDDFDVVSTRTLVSDDFDRLGALGGSTTSDGSAVWQHTTGTATINTDGAARTGSGVNAGGGYIVDTTFSDVDVSIDVSHADQWAALVLRETDANNRLEIGIRPDTTPQKVWIDIYSGTGYTGSRSADVTITLPANLRVVAVGTNIKVHLDDTVILDETVTENAGATSHGIATYVDAVTNAGAYVSVDNFRIALPPPAPLVTDDFNRTGSLGGSTTSDGNNTWSLFHARPHTDPARNIDLTLDGATAALDGPGGTDWVTAGGLVDTGTADVEVQFDITASTGEYTDVIVRALDVDNFLTFVVAKPTSEWRLERKVAGTVTTLASGAFTATYPHTVKVRSVATSVRAYIDGTEVASVTVTDHADNTRHGLHLQARGTERTVVDDFAVFDAPQTPPPAPAGLSTTVSDGSVTLSWNAVAAPDVASYTVHRDGVAVATVAAPTTSYTDTGLTNGTAYSYTVTAIDDEGAASDPSAAVTASPSPFTTGWTITGALGGTSASTGGVAHGSEFRADHELTITHLRTKSPYSTAIDQEVTLWSSSYEMLTQVVISHTQIDTWESVAIPARTFAAGEQFTITIRPRSTSDHVWMHTTGYARTDAATFVGGRKASAATSASQPTTSVSGDWGAVDFHATLPAAGTLATGWTLGNLNGGTSASTGQIAHGAEFIANYPIKITDLRTNNPYSAAVDHEVTLWSASHVKLAQVTISHTQFNTWKSAAITPQTFATGDRFIVTVRPLSNTYQSVWLHSSSFFSRTNAASFVTGRKASTASSNAQPTTLVDVDWGGIDFNIVSP